MFLRRTLSTCLLFIPALATAADLMLAQDYQAQNVSGWLMSEKLDGVRAYWDGRRLISRQGHPFTPPAGFTRHFPPFALDGELYSRRGRFEHISAAVRSSQGDWSDIKLHVFDVPDAQGTLPERLARIQEYLRRHPEANIVVIEQRRIDNIQQARRHMEAIVRQGGEGVILRDPALPYQSGRSSGYLKLKPQADAECTVTRHYPGKGKYSGQMGALGCRNELGEFKIGSGFKDADRVHPPAIGSRITYRYRGFTAKGLPRFPTYLRPRPE